MSSNLDRVAALTRELAEIATRIIQDQCDVPADQAEDAGLSIARAVCEEFGGQLIYVPMNSLAKVDQRDRDMLAAYVAAGRDIVPVAAQFGVCIQTAYRRIKLAEAAAYAMRQGGLF